LATVTPFKPPKPSRPRKLSYRETAELAELPDRIDALERERERLYLSLSDPAVLRDGAAVAASRARLEALESEIAELTGRWETLETIAAGVVSGFGWPTIGCTGSVAPNSGPSGPRKG
jgi:ATP-binding cassette subfamily F protein uup